tara:strand:- start:136 stop:249 length:114 start_codon:yes stop_codon:yes gene_type:complete
MNLQISKLLDYCKYILENKADDLINKSEQKVVADDNS